MSKTVKIKNIYETDNKEPRFTHQCSNSNMKSSGRIRRRIILGEKFDYGEKAKEKENYVLYVAGQGQEKKEIEEMEQFAGRPKKQEKIVEEKEIIDNYQYHETKDIKKKHKKNTETHHQRLCSPFERTKIRKYSSYTTEPIQNGYKVIKTIDLVNKKDYSRNLKPRTKNSSENINNSKVKITINSNKNETIPNVYETYKSSYRNISSSTISNNQKSISHEGSSSNIIYNNKIKKINDYKSIDHNELNYMNSKEMYLPQNVVNYEYQEETISSRPSYEPMTTMSIKRRNNQIPMPINRLKYGSKIKPQKRVYEGPKYQYIGKDRPKSGNLTRRKLFPGQQVHKKQKKEKKGYIPFSGHGTRLGQGSIDQIPRPIPKPYVNNGQKEEENFPLKIEKTYSYTNISETKENNSTTNITNINNLNQGNLQENKSCAQFSNLGNYNKIKKNTKKFPGKGVKVGGSKTQIERKIGLSSDFVSGMSYSEYTKYEQKTTQIEDKENYCNENIIHKQENEGIIKEIFCPVHGKQLVKMRNNDN